MSQNGTSYVNHPIIHVKSRIVLLQCGVCCECNLMHSCASREWLSHGNSAEDRCRRDLIWPAFNILNTTLVLYFWVQNHLQLQAVGQFWWEPFLLTKTLQNPPFQGILCIKVLYPSEGVLSKSLQTSSIRGKRLRMRQAGWSIMSLSVPLMYGSSFANQWMHCGETNRCNYFYIWQWQ